MDPAGHACLRFAGAGCSTVPRAKTPLAMKKSMCDHEEGKNTLWCSLPIIALTGQRRARRLENYTRSIDATAKWWTLWDVVVIFGALMCFVSPPRVVNDAIHGGAGKKNGEILGKMLFMCMCKKHNTCRITFSVHLGRPFKQDGASCSRWDVDE